MTPQMVYEMIGLSTNHSQHNFSEWFARQKRNTPNLPSISITRAFHAIEKYNYDQWKNSLETL
jgi:thiosulfate reductase cytochrome b subunit